MRIPTTLACTLSIFIFGSPIAIPRSAAAAEDDFSGSIGSDQYWSSAFYPRGFTQEAWECASFPDGPQAVSVSGDSVFVAGPFTHVADRAASGVALWDGSRWNALGSDSLPVDLREMVLYHGRPVVAGSGLAERSYRLVFQWTDGGWMPLGASPVQGNQGQVRGLVTYGGDLIAGGAFSIGDSARTIHVARWDGSAWSPMGSRLDLTPEVTVYAFGEYTGSLYAGGSFGSDAGADSLHALARWTGSDWEPVPGLTRESSITSLTEYDGDLIVAGVLYLNSDPLVYHAIAKWDGNTWEPFDTGFPVGEGGINIRSFHVTGNELIAAGDYHRDVVINPLLASFRDGMWVDERPSVISTCIGGYFSQIASYKEGLVAAGSFLGLDGAYMGYIAWRDQSGWHPVGPAGKGVDGWIDCLLPGSDGLYAGGSFSESVSGQRMSSVGRWDGNAWHPLGGGVSGSVSALAWYRGHLIAGGSFSTPREVGASNIAEWDGEAWHPLGSGTNSAVLTLAVYQGDLYAGGAFTQAGDQAAGYLARWDGSAWHPVDARFGGRPNPLVASLVVYANDLIVTGSFLSVDDVSVPGIARWDGNRWNAMGHPTWAAATSPALWNGKVAVKTLGSEPRISLWDGLQWTNLSFPMFEQAQPLGSYKGTLLIALSAAAPPGAHGRLERLALWDGNRVYRLGSGVNGDWLGAAAVWNGTLYLGGEFRYAGDVPSRNIAAYSGEDLAEPVFPARLAVGPNPFTASTTIVVSHAANQEIRLDLFDILGRRMRTFTSVPDDAEASIFAWDGRDLDGRRLPSGRYFLRMRSPGKTVTQGLVIVR